MNRHDADSSIDHHTAAQGRDNKRDALAVARLYADEDSDRGYLARQVVRLRAKLAEYDKYVAEFTSNA